jgi:hypothetical protein
MNSTAQDLIYLGVILAGVLAGVFGHKWHMSRFVPKNLVPLEQEAKAATVAAENFSLAPLASDAARLSQTVDKLVLQYAGAAGKNVVQLTAPDLQNVVAYVLHSLDPVDRARVTKDTVASAHAKLVAAHNALTVDPTFQAAQTAAAYQSGAPTS